MAATCTFSLFLFLFFSIILIVSSSASSEVDALLSFKSNIEDPSNSLSTWSNSSTPTTHYCNWTGVSCTSTPPIQVTSLNLQALNLSGEIPASLCDLHNLSHLNLADNLFNQPIPLHLAGCASLQSLNLSNNLIWGTIPHQIGQYSSLRVLDLSKNHIEGKIPESIGLLRDLQVLNLGSNLISGTVPPVLGNFTELVVLDLSENAFLVSELPSGVGELEKLELLLLQRSGFYGGIPDSFVGLQNLKVLDLSQNNISGGISQPLVGSFKSLVSFDVSQNRLLGPFPDGICNAKGLINLSLHTNSLNGSVPESVKDCLNLEKFQIQNNQFSGDFPGGLWSLPNIKVVRAENNRFSGYIPDSVSMATQLEQVQIDNNSFTGKIPQGLGHVKSLYRFSGSLNRFYGDIPPNFCDSPVLSIINLSHNALSGQIPELRKCRRLVSLALADNSLTGEIPPSLADLQVLTYLDLSANNLSGPIPQEFQNLKLALLNVSFNQLSGRVPYSLISGLPASFFQGNTGLCGPGLPDPCSDYQTGGHKTGLTQLTCALISVAFGVGVLIVAAGFFVYHRSSMQIHKKGAWRSVFFYPLRVTEQDLIMGMDEKSAAGGGGAFGRVYVLSLPSGELIAVKKLVNYGIHSSKALKSEIKILGKIRHKNIAKILGFFHSDESIFLIYEFLSSGSLGDLIRRSDFRLQWSVRLKIAIGVAQGLAYLHKDYIPHLLHRNVKSNNVLLNAEFEPKLTHFALDRVIGEAALQTTVASESPSSCYNAPECGYTKKAMEQMDVYSFGVILLELLTGRQAEQNEMAEESLDVVKWVRRKINITNGCLQVLDPRISNSSEKEMLGALQIALHCTSVVPEKRPSMPEVVRSLQSLGSRSTVPSLYFSISEGNPVPV